MNAKALLLLTGTLTLGAVLALVAAQGILAQQPGINRKVLLTEDIRSTPGKEGTVYIATIAPGVQSAGPHYHIGQEFFYVLEGSAILKREGQPPLALKAGDSGTNLPKQIHDVGNPSATEPVKFVVFIVNEKGQPLATPAQMKQD
jgi:quercetin dioxygenase-like cupin family protein